MKFSIVAVITAFLMSSIVAHPLEKRTTNDTKIALEDVSDNSNDLKTAFGKPYAIFQPKVVVVSMFELERDPWLKELDFVHNVSVPGLSPLYPQVHFTTNYTIMQATTGEGEINAASSITALLLNPLFDFSKSYFLIAGIAGGESSLTTIGSVTFAKYAVQVGLQYQVDYREYIHTNPNWTSGYFGYGVDNPWTYPANVYGTEVFELNENLRDRAVKLAKTAELNNGTEANAKFRALYNETAARSLPKVVACDSYTSDNYYFGNVLSDYFKAYGEMMTNSTGSDKFRYCSTAQEDNASLEAFLRMDLHGLVDFSRVVVMRTISDFARPPPSYANDTVGFFNDANQGGISASIANLVIAGKPFVHDVLTHWDDIYAAGVKPDNYIGDILQSIGGVADYGKDSFEVA